MPALLLVNLGQRHDADGTLNALGLYVSIGSVPGAPDGLGLVPFNAAFADNMAVTVTRLVSPGPFNVDETFTEVLEVDITSVSATLNPSNRSTFTIKVQDDSINKDKTLTITNVSGGSLTLRNLDSVTLDKRSDGTYEAHSG